MATVYRRGKVWWCAYAGYDGVRRIESTGLRSRHADPARDAARTEASLYAGEREYLHALVKTGRLDPSALDARDHATEKIDEHVDGFVESIASRASKANARGILAEFRQNHGADTVGEWGWPAIMGKCARHLDDIAARGVQVRRVNDHLRVLRAFGDYLWRHGLIRANEVAKVRPVRGRSAQVVEHRAFTVLEADRLTSLVAPPGLAWTPPPEPWATYYMLRLWTGLRGSEASQLHRGDLDLGDDPTLTVRADVAKTGMAAKVPIARRLAERLRSHGGMRTGPLFALPCTTHRGLHLQRHVAAARLERRTLINQRSFRMTFTTWARAAGLDGDLVGTLRRDAGRGSQRLRTWTYSDYDQLGPMLRAGVDAIETWYDAERVSWRDEKREARA